MPTGRGKPKLNPKLMPLLMLTTDTTDIPMVDTATDTGSAKLKLKPNPKPPPMLTTDTTAMAAPTVTTDTPTLTVTVDTTATAAGGKQRPDYVWLLQQHRQLPITPFLSSTTRNCKIIRPSEENFYTTPRKQPKFCFTYKNWDLVQKC